MDEYNFDRGIDDDFVYFRESKITNDDYESAASFDAFPPNRDLKLDLYMAQQTVSTLGQARTNQKPNEDDISIMEKQDKNYRISVQRLLWVDGKYHSKSQNKPKDATLIVLKFHLQSLSDGDGKPIRKIYAQLDFGAKTGNGPEVVGWAPFNQTQRTNQTSADKIKERNNGVGLHVGLEMAGAMGNYTRNSSQAWTQTYFDKYSSAGVAVNKRVCGVRWNLMQNAMENHGVKPEFLAYVLLTRSENDPYLVKFTMNVTAGHLGSTLDQLRLSRLKEDKSSFMVTPNAAAPIICKLEGKKILEKINLENLECLMSEAVDTELRLPWEEEEVPTRETTRGGEGDQQSRETAVEHGPSRQVGPPATALQMEWGNLTTDHPHSRLLMLETRMAQMEHRLALQDMTIAQLWQELQRTSMPS